MLLFPNSTEMAHAYFDEAVRHLQDARILHANARFAASITSAMKSVELALKSALYLHGAAGWLQPVLTSHDVMTKLAPVGRVTDTFVNALQQQDTTLRSDIEAMERLVPSAPNINKLSLQEAINTEYPFFADTQAGGFHLYVPFTHFTQDDSMRYFGTARRLLSVLPHAFPEIAGWNVTLCDPL